MNQKFSWALFSSGLVSFMTSAAEMLKAHQSWSEFYSTPVGASHLVVLGGSFTALVVGALGANLPRGQRRTRRDDHEHHRREQDHAVQEGREE